MLVNNRWCNHWEGAFLHSRCWAVGCEIPSMLSTQCSPPTHHLGCCQATKTAPQSIHGNLRSLQRLFFLLHFNFQNVSQLTLILYIFCYLPLTMVYLYWKLIMHQYNFPLGNNKVFLKQTEWSCGCRKNMMKGLILVLRLRSLLVWIPAGILCGVCMFSLYMRGISLYTCASSPCPKTCMLG